MKFEVGMYVRYLNKVWVVDFFYEDMMFIRNMDNGHLEIVLAYEYDRVEVY